MGVVNVTPDSFSDGGSSSTPSGDRARARGWSPRAPDLSTSAASRRGPGPRACPPDEELARVGPVVEGSRGGGAAISIDTSKRAVAEAALDAGAAIVNDVTALGADARAGGALRGARLRRGADAHARERRARCRSDPTLRRRRRRRQAFLAERIEFALARGIARSGSGSTPGSASARRSSTTSSCCAASASCARSAARSCVGTSRKSFIGKITGREVGERLGGTIAVERARAGAWRRDLPRPRRAPVREALQVAEATLAASRVAGSDSGAGGWRRGGARRCPDDVLTSRSSLAACRFTRTTASPTPSRRSASGSSSTSRFDVPDCDATADRPARGHRRLRRGLPTSSPLAATERGYRTLERLCPVDRRATAGALRVADLEVRAAKPEPPLPLAVEEVAVEVVRERPPTPMTRRPRSVTGYLGPRLERRRPCGPPARGDRRLLAEHGVEVEAVSSVYETEPVGRDHRPARLPQRRGPRPTDLGRSSSCSTSARRSRSRTGGSSAAPATGRVPIDIDVLLLGDARAPHTSGSRFPTPR